MSSIRLRPLPSVVDAGTAWIHPPLDITLPAPPSTVDRYSPLEDIDRATAALFYGLASGAVVFARRPPGSLLWTLFHRGRYASRSEDLADRPVRALAQISGLLVRVAAVELACLSIAFLVGAATGTLLGMVLVGFCLAFFCSVVVHECGHVLAFRLLAGRRTPAIVVARFVSGSLIRPALPGARDIVVTCAGPLLPVLIWLLVAAVPGTPVPLIAALGAIALPHLLYLLLPIGDGAALRTHLRKRSSSC